MINSDDNATKRRTYRPAKRTGGGPEEIDVRGLEMSVDEAFRAWKRRNNITSQYNGRAVGK